MRISIGCFLLTFALLFAFGCGQSTDIATTSKSNLNSQQGDPQFSAPGSGSGFQAAAKPPCIPAFHDGDTVFFTVVNENQQGVGDRGNLPDVAIPLYAFGFPPNQPQPDVLSAIPTEPDYKPWWKVILVTILDGRDVTTDPFTSEQEILAAAAAGDVTLTDAEFVFLCQVLPSCN